MQHLLQGSSGRGDESEPSARVPPGDLRLCHPSSEVPKGLASGGPGRRPAGSANPAGGAFGLDFGNYLPAPCSPDPPSSSKRKNREKQSSRQARLTGVKHRVLPKGLQLLSCENTHHLVLAKNIVREQRLPPHASSISPHVFHVARPRHSAHSPQHAIFAEV